MKIKILSIIAICIMVIGICVWLMSVSFSNNTLMLGELKAYFQRTISLNFHPNMDKVSEVQIGGAVSMTFYDTYKYGNAVYNKRHHMEQITDYLNTLPLVESTVDELPNKSSDAFIQYYDEEGNLAHNFVLYGQIFIKDVNNQKLYRVKRNGGGIIEKLEKLNFK